MLRKFLLAGYAFMTIILAGCDNDDIKSFVGQGYNVLETSGSTITQKIQNTLNMTVSDHQKIVVIPQGSYTIDKTLKIPSDTTLVLNGAKLTMADGVNERIITNSDFVNGNQNIFIFGFGDAELNGNRAGQVLPSTPYKNIGVHFYKVNHFGISGITVASTMRWALVPEASTDGAINDVTFNLEGYQNQDGVHILGPSHNIQVTHIRGTFGDDACVANARPSTGGLGIYQGYGKGGDVTGITFDGIQVKGTSMDGKSHTSILRTSSGGSNVVSGIVLKNATGEGILSVARLGGDDITTVNTQRDITIDTVHVISGYNDQFGQGVHVLRDVGNLKIHNITTATGGRMVLIDNFPYGWQAPAKIDGLIVSDCVLKADVAPSESDYVIKFKGASVKRAQFKNINIKGMSKGTIGYTGIRVKDTALENVSFDIAVKDLKVVMKTEGSTTMKNVLVRYASDKTISPFDWDLAISKGLVLQSK